MINLTVGHLKECIENLPDDMDVVIPISKEDDPDSILGFRHVRTMGILSSKYEKDKVLCINTSGSGLDIFGQLQGNHVTDAECETLVM